MARPATKLAPGRSIEATLSDTDLRAVLLSKAEINVWCEACRLPTAESAVGAIEVDGQPLGMVRVTRCTECGHATRRPA